MVEGGCHCGAVRFAVEGAPVFSAICHCADCRRCSGAPVLAVGLFAADAFRWTRGEARAYASSEHTRRYFCAACGTGLAYINEVLLPGIVDIRLAALDDPEAFPPTDQLQTGDTLSWMIAAHTLTAHVGYPPPT